MQCKRPPSLGRWLILGLFGRRCRSSLPRGGVQFVWWGRAMKAGGHYVAWSTNPSKKKALKHDRPLQVPLSASFSIQTQRRKPINDYFTLETSRPDTAATIVCSLNRQHRGVCFSSFSKNESVFRPKTSKVFNLWGSLTEARLSESRFLRAVETKQEVIKWISRPVYTPENVVTVFTG